MLRVLWIEADPPIWTPDPTLMDEGLWADSARGLVRFGDPFADDLGNAWLATPLHSALLALIYTCTGQTDLFATRLPQAIAGAGLVLLAGIWIGRAMGRIPGLFAAAALALSPFFWVHSRMGLVETTQSLAIAGAFVLLFPARAMTEEDRGNEAGRLRLALAGLAMAAAVAIKPSAALFGAIPLAVVFLTDAWRQGESLASSIRRGAWVVLGGGIGLGVVAAIFWWEQREAFIATMAAEGGMGSAGIPDRLSRLGLVLSREREAGVHGVWPLLRAAPLMTCAATLWALTVVLMRWTTRLSMHARKQEAAAPFLPVATPRPVPRAAVLAAVWFAVVFLVQESSYQHAARRYVLAGFPLAVLAAAWLELIVRGPWGRPASAGDAQQASTPPHTLARLGTWLLITALPFAAIKPWLANRIAQSMTETSQAGFVAGAILLIGWGVLCIALASSRGLFARITPTMESAAFRIGPIALAVAALFEALLLSQYFSGPPARTVIEAQQAIAAELGGRVGPNDIVLGQHASLLFQGLPVRTVRRSKPGDYSGPRPNPDVAERLKPRFVIDYSDDRAEYADVTTAPLYLPIFDVGYLRERDGETYRNALRVFERQR